MNDNILAERTYKKMHLTRIFTYVLCMLLVLLFATFCYLTWPLLASSHPTLLSAAAPNDSTLSQTLFVSYLSTFVIAFFVVLCTSLALLLYLFHGWNHCEQERLKTIQKDDLTGAFLYKPFIDQAKRQLGTATRDKKQVGLLVFEVGNILLVNQRVGRDFGDRLLQACGIVTESCLRDTDLFGRLTGLRFAILLATSDTAAHQIVQQRLLQVLQEVRHSSSIGELSLNVRLYATPLSLDQPIELQIDHALEHLNKQFYFWDCALISPPDSYVFAPKSI